MDRFYGSINLSYDVLKTATQSLTLRTILGADVITDDRRRYKERRIASALSSNSGADEAGFIRDESYTDNQFDANLTATYTRQIQQRSGGNLISRW
jgi:hypothetical protein